MGVDSNRIIEKIINVILDVAIFIFGIILLISIYNNVQTKILKNSYSSFFGYTVFGVQTGSMADEINAGDWIIVKKANKIAIDDVVTYMQDGEFITHRVVEAYKNTFITKGDANNTKDAPINKEQIVGKVVKILPNFEIFRKTLFNPIVLLFLIITLYLGNLLFKKDRLSIAKNNKKNISEYISNIKIFDTIKNMNIITKIKNNSKKNNSNINKNKENKSEVVKKEKNNIKEESENKIKQVEITQINETENLDNEIILTPTENVTEEDLDKTMCFRMISVNKNEIENAYNMELPKNEENEEEKAKEKKEIVEETKEEEIKNNLEMLQKKGKKCKNIIEKCMYIKEQEIEKIIGILLGDEKSKVNYPTIKDAFLKAYMDGRYYNYCGDVNVEFTNKNVIRKLDSVILELNEKLIKEYKGSDTRYSDKVFKVSDIFILINYFENNNKSNTLNEKRENYSKKIKRYLDLDDLDERKLKKIVDEIIKVQKLHAGMIKYTLDKLDTNLFKINYNSLSKKNIYATELDHNIAFSKIYSDYIVDKTYTEGVVAEDKLAVQLTLLSSQIINNMINNEFEKKYVIYIPESVYKKNNKLDDIFDMFEDEFAKNSVIVLVQYSKVTENKDIIKKLIKQGYHFAIDINDTVKFKVSDQEIFEMVDYLFLSNKNPNKESMLLFIKKMMHEKIIYDEISTKIGSYMR